MLATVLDISDQLMQMKVVASVSWLMSLPLLASIVDVVLLLLQLFFLSWELAVLHSITNDYRFRLHKWLRAIVVL